jgi:Mn2+/Fe2+ NRAMP family transporter
MTDRTEMVLKRIGQVALAATGVAFLVAMARVDVGAYYEEQARKAPPRWTDANRWE